MTTGKVMEGVFAIHKPTGISSAQALRDLQRHFNPSTLFAPWISVERSNRERENHNQRNRRKLKQVQVKIGHGGTLDPLATGVLICGVGKGTKSLQDFLMCTKVYEAVVLFGTSTDTYDRVGKVLRQAPYEHVTKEVVEEALKRFRGKFMQLPPLFSALKMDGKPLYEYAREGKEIPREIQRRPVDVLNLEMIEWMEGGTHPHEAPTDEAGYAEINVANKLWTQEGILPGVKVRSFEKEESFEQKKRKLSADQDDLVHERPSSKKGKVETLSSSEVDKTMSGGLADPSSQTPSSSSPTKSKGPPAARLRMTVTSGFYVRSLCHDLGTAVGSAALMAELERTRQGEFELGKNVVTYDQLSKGEEVWGPVVEGMLDDWHEKTKPARNMAAAPAPVSAPAPVEPAAEPVKTEDVVEVAETSGEIKAEVLETSGGIKTEKVPETSGGIKTEEVPETSVETAEVKKEEANV